MRYQHLLVPVDFTDSNAAALDAALELAAQHRARTTLLHVIEAIDQAGDDDATDLHQFYAELEAGVREKLSELAMRFEHAGLSVRAEIVVGRRVRDIVQYSATESIDLIVMKSHRVDLKRPQELWVSVSQQVSFLCQCPVMLVK